MQMNCSVICNEDDGHLSAKIEYRIATIVRKSKCECSITRGNKTVTAGSLLILMALDLKDGDIVTITSDNADCVYKICEILQEIDKVGV